MSGLGFGERNHVANRLGAGHQHHQPIQTKGQPTVRWAAEFQRIQQEAEFIVGFFLTNAQRLEHRPLHLGCVNTNGTAAQLGTVQYHIIGTG